MTIRTALPCPAKDYSNFRDGLEAAPAGLFEASRNLADAVERAMDEIDLIAATSSLRTDRCDQAFEFETIVWDYLRRCNPEIEGDVQAVIGLGETLSEATPEVRQRILDGLRRDERFLAKLAAIETLP